MNLRFLIVGCGLALISGLASASCSSSSATSTLAKLEPGEVVELVRPLLVFEAFFYIAVHTRT